MGWNSWNTFGEHINETMIKETADSMVEMVYSNVDMNILSLTTAGL